MDNFDPYNVLLAITTNIPVLLMTAFVLQGHICSFIGCLINELSYAIFLSESTFILQSKDIWDLVLTVKPQQLMHKL